MDEAFCREFGVSEGGVDQLRREVEDNMRRELDGTVRGRMRQQLFGGGVLACCNRTHGPVLRRLVGRLKFTMRAGRRQGQSDPPAASVRTARGRFH